jgi:DNA-binding NarL/FixJ family response regulator
MQMGLEAVMSNVERSAKMHALLLCRDAQFLGTTNHVLQQISGTPKVAGGCSQALAAIAGYKFDVVVVDWREIDDVAEFLCAVRRSALNHDCVLVAIVRDVLDVRQAFTAGVHFLIHKPASVVQIERCLRTAYPASLARRRKTYRAPIEAPATLGMRHNPALQATIVNLGEGGAGLRIIAHGRLGEGPAVGDAVTLSFVLPGTRCGVHAVGRVVWCTAAGGAGIEFTWISDAERIKLEEWLTQRLKSSVAELRDQLAASACA